MQDFVHQPYGVYKGFIGSSLKFRVYRVWGFGLRVWGHAVEAPEQVVAPQYQGPMSASTCPVAGFGV